MYCANPQVHASRHVPIDGVDCKLIRFVGITKDIFGSQTQITREKRKLGCSTDKINKFYQIWIKGNIQ